MKTPSDIKNELMNIGYIADDELAAAISVALLLDRPLLIEGAAGVGKTETAKAMAKVLGRELIRLQCHTGIDEARALFEWNYQKQLLALQNMSAGRDSGDLSGSDDMLDAVFSERYLLERPLLRSIRSEVPLVLLIDELDKSEEEFEAFLLELFAEYQVTIPELGTMKARTKPFTVLTSNSTRPLSEALRRRCVYAWLDYPDISKELEIIRKRLPDAEEGLALSVANAVAKLREDPHIMKKPSIAETLDWTSALMSLGVSRLDAGSIRDTIGAAVKSRSDIDEALNLLSSE